MRWRRLADALDPALEAIKVADGVPVEEVRNVHRILSGMVEILRRNASSRELRGREARRMEAELAKLGARLKELADG